MAYDEEPNNEGGGAEDSNSPGFLARQREKQAAKSLAKDGKTLGKRPSLRERATGQAGSKRAGAYERQQAREKADLQKRLGSTASGLAQRDADDKEKGGLFKGGKKKQKKGFNIGGFSMGKRAAAAAAGTGGIGLILGIFSIFSFLGNFQLDHLLSNVDAQTFSRFNAAFSGRSDKWMRSYVNLRLRQIGGETVDKDEVAFRSWEVDNDNPARDWFRTLKTSKWEQELFDDQGIVMATRTGPNGISYVEFEINDEPRISPALQSKYAQALSDVDPGNLESVVAFSNQISDDDFDNFFKTQVFEDDASARKYLRQQSKEKFRPDEVLKRRHFRKDRQNMLGVRDWRFFEKTRTRIEKKKSDIQSRIVQKVFSGNGNISKFLSCLLDPKGKCASNPDPSNPDAQSGNPATGDNPQSDDTGDTNDNGTPDDPDDDFNNGGSGDDETSEIDDAIRNSGDIDPDAPGQVPSEKFAKELRALLAVDGPLKAWKWMKRIATIHDAIHTGGPGLLALAKHAKTQNLVAMHTTLSIARDQTRTGEVDGEDFGATMELLRSSDWGNSEGWATISNNKSGTVEAQAVELATKNEYCEESYKPKPTDFAWFCDADKPNNGGTLASFIETYDNTVGRVLAPVAATVNGVKDAPLIGAALDWFSEKAGDVTNGVIEAVGLKDFVDSSTESVATTAQTYLLDFFGLSPKVDGSNPGDLVNYAVGGGAGAAEASTRAAGGMASTPISRAYSTKLAVEYKKELRDDMSLYERYASLDNHESIAATSLFAVSTKPFSSSFSASLKNIFSFSWAKSFFLSPANAQAADAQDVADWAGVDKYDIPQTCVEMDPLSMTVETGTNFDELVSQTQSVVDYEFNMSWDDVRDGDKFYAEVYKWVNKFNDKGDEAKIAANNAALTVYNCHLLDARVQDGLGFTSGYDSGTGLDSQTATDTPGVSTGNVQGQVIGDPSTDSSSVPCASGTTDLGIIDDAYAKGSKVSMRMCAIPGFRSTGQESNSGNAYYVDKADGNVIINSRVAGAWYALFTAARADGLTLSALSSWRTHAHQIDLCNGNAGCSSGTYNAVAKPGTSNHQAGHAIDFNDASFGGAGPGSTPCENKQTADTATYRWLEQNAKKFGLGQLANESWHWDASADGCGL